MNADAMCPVCGSSDHDAVVSIPSVPVLVNAQVRPDQGSVAVRGDMDLVVCHGCAHLFNRSFDPELLDYDATYENTLHYSSHFQQFARSLADRLVRDHGLIGVCVAELGSGPGHFLSMLCDAGVARGLGWDPSYDPGRLGAPEHPAVTVSTDQFPDDGSVPVELAFSQHVLEHLGEPVRALAAMRSAVLDANGVVYTEVPNGQLMMEHGAIWDLIYEHRSYFVPLSLDLVCRRAGLRVTSMGAAFGDQFLWCEAIPGDSAADALPDPSAVEQAVVAATVFGATAAERIERARDDLATWAAAGPVALWGAGSKGVTYLNLVADVAEVAAVVDINPRKSGWGVPGTSFAISGPDVLIDVQPRTVVAANPIYVGEIAAALEHMGIDACVRPLWE